MNRLPNPTRYLALILATCSLVVAGCSDSGDPAALSAGTGMPLPDGLFVESAPEGAQSITKLKASAKEGDEVVVRVVVGGRMKPLVEGRASAAVVDAGVANSCLEVDDHCETPWDYCCTSPEEVNANLASIQVVDADGRVLDSDWSSQIKPLSTLVVRGVVGPRADDQALTINATGIYIEPAAK